MHKLISYRTNQTQPDPTKQRADSNQTPCRSAFCVCSGSALVLLKNDQMSPLVYWEFTWNELTGSMLNSESASYFSV